MLKKSQKKEILKHLFKLNIKKDQNIVLHANLSTFGIFSNYLPKFIIKEIIKIIGKKGTLIMPMYNLNLDKKITYDKNKLYEIRAISNIYKEFFKTKNKYISNSLVHRHFGVGKLAKKLSLESGYTSIGKKSDFEFFLNNNFKLILLGCKASEGATYLHHLEAIMKVPYRKWIKIERKIYNKKNLKIKTNYFARKNKKYIENFDKVFENKRIIKQSKIVRNKYGKSFAIKFSNLHKIGVDLLKRNKYAFVKKK